MVGLDPQSFRVIEGSGLAEDQSETPNEHVGAFLREARENTGRSGADVASTLRIRAKFLHAIEDGRYGDLPGPTYVVGFIRSYADYLGLDTASLLAQFKTESNGVESHPDLEFPVPPTVGWFPTGKVVASCAVLAAAVFAGWFYLQTENLVDVAAVPLPPGLKSAIGAETANEQSADANGATTVVAAAGPVASSMPVDDAAAAAVDGEFDDNAAAADQAANPQPADPETATPGGTAEETSINDGGQPYRLPVPIATLVSADPLATGSDRQRAAPSGTEREEVPTATVATAPAQPIENSAPADNEPPPVSVSAAEPPAVDENELTPVTASAGEPPAPADNEPTALTTNAAEPPAPAAETKVVEPTPPVVASPAPTVHVAALPSVPTARGETDAGEDGRTYGVINQQARVVIGARTDSWVQVLDGKQNVVLTRMLRAGDRYLVPNRNDLVMLTGNAGGLIISVDGQPVPEIGSDGAILHNVRLDIELLKAGRAVIQ